MKIAYACMLIISLFQQQEPKQSTVTNEKVRMLEFLVKNGEIDTTNGNDMYIYKNAVYEKMIYRKQKLYSIIIFGTLSPHSRRYIALNGFGHISFLKTVNLTNEVDAILLFLNKIDIDKLNLIRVLSEIAKAYQYNIKLNNQMVIKTPT